MTKLLLRFYDPTAGAIRLDGADIRTLNLNWYRQQIGYVGKSSYEVACSYNCTFVLQACSISLYCQCALTHDVATYHSCYWLHQSLCNALCTARHC
jgi:ABC-type transport system involved in cytochrome bd biosynthesis fused ATPase/permease subunit